LTVFFNSPAPLIGELTNSGTLDWHKDAKALRKAKMHGLASEEWMSTQRDLGNFQNGYEGYD